MYRFLLNNRDELIARCKSKVALRPHRAASEAQLANGVPLFLDQLTLTLRAEEDGDPAVSRRISGAAGGDAGDLSELGVSAAAHGKVLLELGFTVDQVVHDYGDLCQAITDLAVERDAPFAISEFRTLNRCLDNAIADAVTEFARQRDVAVALRSAADENQRLGFLVHELRNHLQVATMAFSALESGRLSIGGSTSALVKRNLTALADLLTQTISEVRTASKASTRSVFTAAEVVEDVRVAASLQARVRNCVLRVPPVDPDLAIFGNRMLLTAALLNLLQNALKFTQPDTEVVLTVRGLDDRILIDVQDHCGGLPDGFDQHVFKPFVQAGSDTSGLGLGLAIARQNVEADRGRLTVRDLPGSGCIFTVELPRHTTSRTAG